jgi:hypothetical protein
LIPDNVCFLSFLVGPVAGPSGRRHGTLVLPEQKAKGGRNHTMSTRTTDARSARGRNRALLRVPVLAGVGYAVAWVASQSFGAPSPSIAASGTQLVTSFAGHGGPNMAMFVLAEGVAAVFLAVIAIVVTRPALRQGSVRLAGARTAAKLAAGFGLAAAAVSWVELGLGTWLIFTLVPEGRSGTAGATWHALNRVDGAKMFVLAVMAAALSVLAMTTPSLPRWLAPLGFLLAAALVVSGLGYVLLAPGLGTSVWVSGILLVVFVASVGVTFGLRDGRTDV